MASELERASLFLLRLREILPSAVPSSALQALYVHDDALSAIDDVTLTQAQRESLPEDIRSELEALEALFRDDPTG
jgi:hypothetical protein